MARELHISDEGLRLITGFEGFIGHPYRDAVGVLTIGYGHTEGVGPNSAHLTQSQALDLLRHDLAKKYEPYVNAMHLPLTQGQFDALVSFVYNLGPGVIGSGSTMGQELRAHNWRGAANAFLLYDHAGGRVLPGLQRRREAERTLFLKQASPVTKWTAELTKRRFQLKHSKDPGQRHFLMRRINALKAAIRKH